MTATDIISKHFVSQYQVDDFNPTIDDIAAFIINGEGTLAEMTMLINRYARIFGDDCDYPAGVEGINEFLEENDIDYHMATI